MAAGPSTLEFFHNTPSGDELASCLIKHGEDAAQGCPAGLSTNKSRSGLSASTSAVWHRDGDERREHRRG
jgi:hypothetical protein